ncbi:MAG: FtsQ-type POTRA domain-containing protein [Acidobacteria bacterium]|nr:FtsQ-type POTRA domain-containing protein [Acidobacteriota bacterium]MBV9476211.1 FtsQ-type POTRA domain-containing protein [Acidobacteriota bacterium]
MNFDTTASRFLRPTDVARLRRNQRRIQVQRLAIIIRNALLAAVLAAAALWAWRQTQASARFAVRTIELAGVVHTPRAAIESVTRQYVGLNLFRIDIARVQRDLAHLGWVKRIDIEKTIPDTLRIKITERAPVALLRDGERLLYVDDEGTGFAELAPSVGDDDLPVIVDAQGDELARTIAMLRELRARDRELYARVSEVRPIPPRGFALFDRQLGAFVYADADRLAEKWRSLYAILRAENQPHIEYADLRFADRVIVKALETSHVQN